MFLEYNYFTEPVHLFEWNKILFNPICSWARQATPTFVYKFVYVYFYTVMDKQSWI